MTEAKEDLECVSKKPWSEVLNRTAKIFVFGIGKEGGRSVGKVILYIILALILFSLIGSALNSFFGWFDWIGNPFSGAWDWVTGWTGPSEEQAAAPVTADDEPGWICSRWTKWNPGC